MGGPKIQRDTYGIIEVWQPLEHLSLDLLLKYSPEKNELLSFIHDLVAEQKFPARNDGRSALSHFFNVAYYINQAGANFLSVCAGMGHDFVEDKVDQFKREEGISGSRAVKILDMQETKVLSELEEKVVMFSEQICLPKEIPQKLVSSIALLTRHKRHMYYRSLSEIFNCDDEELKEVAIQVKLADRMHNIQHLKDYEEEEKIYQCFKYVFILNNVKRYLIESGGITTGVVISSEETATEKLFRKCCKATHAAFVKIQRAALEKGIDENLESDLQFYFSKFDGETNGLDKVTDWDNQELHPLKLYQAIVKKYDTRLHHEFEEFKWRKQQEIDYCQELLSDQKFSDERIEAIINYKDAYALGMIVRRLPYYKDYLVNGFGCSDLCTRRKSCLSVAKKKES